MLRKEDTQPEPITQTWIELADGRQLPLDKPVPIGRIASNTIVIDNDSVSRRHAILQMDPHGRWIFTDLSSTNGSLLNDRRVAESTRLHDGDKITIGGVSCVFRTTTVGDESDAGSSINAALTTLELNRISSWMLLADVIGSSTLAQQMDESELRPRLNRLFAQLRDLIQTHQGTVNKYLGDGLLAYWNADQTDTARMRAALTALTEYQWQSPLPLRLVLHHGWLHAGGGLMRGEESLSGSDLNFTFRMEKLAGQLRLTVLLSEPALRALEPLPDFVETGRHTVDGFFGEHLFYSLQR
jgi:adenylate cyclase